MSNIKKIVLSGYYGFDNIGDEAVLLSIVTTLRGMMKDIEIIVLSNNPQKTSVLYGVQSVDRWDIKKIAKEIQECDLLVSGGGSLLQDVTSGKTIPYYLAIVKIAQFYKKKVVFYSQGIGPVQKGWSRWLIKHVVNKVEGIFVRDAASKKLLEEIGVTQRVEEALDPVLGMTHSSLYERHKTAAPTIGLYMRPWKDKAHDEKLKKEMIPSLIELLKTGYHLCFIPMHYEQDYAFSVEFAKELKEAARGEVEGLEDKVEVVDKMLSIKEVFAYTGSFEFIIGMRLHSLIMAAASKVPMVALSYDPKVVEFMKEIEVGYCIDTSEVEKDAFNIMLQQAIHTRDEQAKHLEAVLERKRERIYLPATYIKTLLEK